MNNLNTILIPRYHAAYGNKIINESNDISPIYSSTKHISTTVYPNQDRYIVTITNLNEPTLTSLNINHCYYYDDANKILCFIKQKPLNDRKILIIDNNDNIFLQRLAVKYHENTDNIITLIKCNQQHYHLEYELFEKTKQQQDHKFYTLINKDVSYELLQQHGLIPGRTNIMCTSCDIVIPYEILNTETANPESILEISAQYHKNKNRIAKHKLVNDKTLYTCCNKTADTDLILLYKNGNTIPLIHYHKLKPINSYEIYDTKSIESLCDMKDIYFFISDAKEHIIDDSIIATYAYFLCDDLKQSLLDVKHMFIEKNFLKITMSLHSIATFISRHAEYSDTIENKIDRGISLLESFMVALKENKLDLGLMSIILYVKQTNDSSVDDNMRNRLFHYVEVINQLYLFPLLEVIIKFIAVINHDPNSVFIKRLSALLQSVYLLPKNNEYFTQKAQDMMLLEAILQAKNI